MIEQTTRELAALYRRAADFKAEHSRVTSSFVRAQDPQKYDRLMRNAISYTNTQLSQMAAQYAALWGKVYEMTEPLYLDRSALASVDQGDYALIAAGFFANPSQDYIRGLWEAGDALSQPSVRAVATKLALTHGIGLDYIARANPGIGAAREIIIETAKAAPPPGPYREPFFDAAEQFMVSLGYGTVFSPVKDYVPPGGVFINA